MDFQTRSLVYRYKFSELEEEIVEYILTHREQIVALKITSLAQQFFTVPNTISRLCTKLGYSGFLELKSALKSELAPRKKQPFSQKEILLRNFSLIDHEKEKEIARVFEKASEVNVFAVGSTAWAARIVVDNFNSVDYKFIFYEYEHEITQKIKTAKNEAFFFISLSGEREPLLSLATETQEFQQKLVSLTMLSKNTLSKTANFSLFCYSPARVVNSSNIQDKTPILVITDSLFNTYREVLEKHENCDCD